MSDEIKRSVTDRSKLPPHWPTNRHAPEFWEALGRAVATFGFLEEVLGKAIFVFTGTKRYAEQEAIREFENWLPQLQIALSGNLAQLIDMYDRSVRDHQESTIENLDELLADLRNANQIRNALCHGAWRPPDDSGASKLFFINRKMEVFGDKVDLAYLERTQVAVVSLICSIVDTVTHMGYQFPGGAGPGRSVLPADWRQRNG